MKTLSMLLALLVPTTVAIAESPQPGDVDASGRPFETDDRAAARADRIDFEGEWMLLLPAGVQRTVTFEAVGKGLYRIGPSELNMAGRFAVRGSRLLSVDENGDVRSSKVYDWRVRSPYLLVLERESDPAADYTSAVLFRRRTTDAGDAPGKRPGNIDLPATNGRFDLIDRFGVE